MNEKVLLASHVFPDVFYLKQCKKGANCTIEGHENYQKRSYRNRFDILTDQGISQLSIPLKKGKNNKMPIQEVCISYDENWIEQLLRSLRNAYNKSPYLLYYEDEISELLHAGDTYLFDLNQRILAYFCDKWHIPIPRLTSQYEKDYDGLDIRSFATYKEYRSESIGLKYDQLYEDRLGFVPHISALDLLFCYGPEGYLYI